MNAVLVFSFDLYHMDSGFGIPVGVVVFVLLVVKLVMNNSSSPSTELYPEDDQSSPASSPYSNIRYSGITVPSKSAQKKMRLYYIELPEGNRDAQFQWYLKAYTGTLFSQPEIAGFIAGDDITDILDFRLKESGSALFMRFHYMPKNAVGTKPALKK